MSEKGTILPPGIYEAKVKEIKVKKSEVQIILVTANGLELTTVFKGTRRVKSH